MGPTPTQQAQAILALEGLGERCGRIIGRHFGDCIAALGDELLPVAAGGYDIRDHVRLLADQIKQLADQWQEATENEFRKLGL